MQTEAPKAESPKRNRRWFQFSLRMLMIGVTLLAIACWVVVDRMRLIRERDDALRREAAARRDARHAQARATGIQREAEEANGSLMATLESERKKRAITTERPPPK